MDSPGAPGGECFCVEGPAWPLANRGSWGSPGPQAEAFPADDPTVQVEVGELLGENHKVLVGG